ncbi:MAG: hypothetical protein ACLGJC_32010 [Alphaproteobacteria bacterium]
MPSATAARAASPSRTRPAGCSPTPSKREPFERPFDVQRHHRHQIPHRRSRRDHLRFHREQHADTLLEFISRPTESFRGLLGARTLAAIVDEETAVLATPPAEEREARAEVMTLIGSFPRQPDNPVIYCGAWRRKPPVGRPT